MEEKMLSKTILLLIFLVLAALISCQTIAKVLKQPLPEIIGTTARESFGFDYQVHVDCTVRNNGASGQVTIFAELRKGGYWKKEETIFLPENESRMVTLTFSEPTFLSGGLTSGSYSCRAS